MENRERARRHWPIAVAVSVVLHGAVVLGLGMLPGRQVVEARSGTPGRHIPFSIVDYDPGEITFLEASEPAAGKNSSTLRENRPSPPAADAGPAAATLKDPLALAGASSPGTTEIGSTGPSDNAGGETTSFFQVATGGRRIVYVVDGSASMGNGALAAACRELHESVKKLPATARFQVIVYNSTAHNLLPRFPGWLEPTPAMVHEVGAALRRQVAEGRTEHGPALQKAFLLEPDAVFFLTDADDLQLEHLQLVKKFNRGRAAVHTIELTTRNRDRAEMPMQILARENRGTYQAVDLLSER